MTWQKEVRAEARRDGPRAHQHNVVVVVTTPVVAFIAVPALALQLTAALAACIHLQLDQLLPVRQIEIFRLGGRAVRRIWLAPPDTERSAKLRVRGGGLADNKLHDEAALIVREVGADGGARPALKNPLLRELAQLDSLGAAELHETLGAIDPVRRVARRRENGESARDLQARGGVTHT